MRNIDADELRKNMEFICMGIMAGTEPYNAPLTEIDNAPTVHHPNCDICEDKAKQYSLGFQDGYLTRKEKPQSDIRWTDKLSVKSNGDIIDFEGRVVGHINLEDMKGGGEND